jgi:phenylalanyl-tRNA synthetase beta chain
VTEETKNIFLESAHFAAKSVRKTSMHHLLRTDAAMVFEKGSDPSITVDAMKRAAMLMKELAGAKITSKVTDIYPKVIEKAQVPIKFKHVDRLIGIKIEREKLMEIFEALHMEVVEQDDTSCVVTVPSSKSDVTREVDVIEEILRIYGLNNVPAPEKVAVSIAPGNRKELYKVRKYLSEYLSGQSFNEAMSLSLSMSKKYKDAGIMSEDQYIYINNTSNVQLDILRPEMLFSSLENLSYNQNRQQRDLMLYEFGKAYYRKDGEMHENEMLTIYGMGKTQAKSWKAQGENTFDYYFLKTHVRNILNKMNIGFVVEEDLEEERFDFGVSWHYRQKEVLRIAKVSQKLKNYFGLKEDIYYAEIDLTRLIEYSEEQMIVEEISKYPGVSRDLALVIDKNRKFEEIRKMAFSTIKKSLKSLELFDVYDNEKQLGEGKISYAISLKFEDINKTLQDKEVDKLMKKFIHKLEQNLQVQVRK